MIKVQKNRASSFAYRHKIAKNDGHDDSINCNSFTEDYTISKTRKKLPLDKEENPCSLCNNQVILPTNYQQNVIILQVNSTKKVKDFHNQSKIIIQCELWLYSNTIYADKQAFSQDVKSVCPKCTIGPAQMYNLWRNL